MTELGSFLEVDFPVPSANRGEYERRVARGRLAMGQRRVVICGLARNVAGLVPKTAARIERLGAMFADYRVVIYENDSHDGTVELLEDWRKRNPRVTILSEARNAPVNRQARCLERARRMAYCRNQYREYVARHYTDFDNVIVVDTDLRWGWSIDGVANTFGHSGWDFVGSYGLIYKRIGLKLNVPLHFDAWAFRVSGSYAPISTKQVNWMRWRRGDPMVKVYSCFGGLGVYRMQAMLRCVYQGSDCEHVAFHRAMRECNLGRLYLNPSQIVVYGRKRRTLDPLILPFATRLTGCRLRAA